MSKQPTSVRLPDITIRQLAELIAATGMTQSEVITTGIDRMYQQEIKDVNAQPNICDKASRQGASES